MSSKISLPLQVEDLYLLHLSVQFINISIVVMFVDKRQSIRNLIKAHSASKTH